jgi:hypothetical protein
MATTTTSPTMPAYNVNPGYQAGSGQNGAVPGVIQVAPSTYSQVNALVPGFGANTNAASNVISSDLAGTISPQTTRNLQNSSAAAGVSGGVPGSGLALENFLSGIGLDSQSLQQTGVGDYLSFLSGVSATQTDPNLATQTATQNAVDASAPNPTMAAQAEQSALNQQLNPASSTSWFHSSTPTNSITYTNPLGYTSTSPNNII